MLSIALCIIFRFRANMTVVGLPPRSNLRTSSPTKTSSLRPFPALQPSPVRLLAADCRDWRSLHWATFSCGDAGARPSPQAQLTTADQTIPEAHRFQRQATAAGSSAAADKPPTNLKLLLMIAGRGVGPSGEAHSARAILVPGRHRSACTAAAEARGGAVLS